MAAPLGLARISHALSAAHTRGWQRAARWGALALLVGVVIGCANTTSSGAIGLQRSQLMILSSEEVNSQAAQGFQKLTNSALSQKKLNTNHQLTTRVRSVGKDLIAQVGVFRQDALKWDWEINVFDSDEINAFCAPGGKIGVYTGIVNRLQLTDDELAAVMGHEIAHALREHSREKMSQKGLSDIAVLATSAATGVDASLLNSGTQLLMHLPNSRAMEMESDVIGLELMARAGYDPRNASSIWKKMLKVSSGKQQPAFFSTHPASEDRIAALDANVPKVLPLYEEARLAAAANPKPAAAADTAAAAPTRAKTASRRKR